MKLADLQGEEDYLRTPRIERSAIKLLWYSDYWDGPRSGMLEYQGKPYWFEICAEGHSDAAHPTAGKPGYWFQITSLYRRYMILQLSAGQLQDELYWHELFRQSENTRSSIRRLKWTASRLS